MSAKRVFLPFVLLVALGVGGTRTSAQENLCTRNCSATVALAEKNPNTEGCTTKECEEQWPAGKKLSSRCEDYPNCKKCGYERNVWRVATCRTSGGENLLSGCRIQVKDISECKTIDE
jgi:hypothetical protein